MPDSPSEPSEQLKQLRETLRNKKERYFVFLGFFIAPFATYIAAKFGASPKFLSQLGWFLFSTFSIAFAIAFTQIDALAKKIKHLRHNHQVVYPGLFGTAPESKVYRVKWEFDRFSTADCQTYQRMEMWVNVLSVALCGLFGWFLPSFLLNLFS